MQALGLIETRGLLPAIECADVMLKTAQVELVGRTFVGSGLVTITITGDVGAVKAAVEAAVTAVEKISQLSLVSQHVIPRPHHEIGSMVEPINDPLANQDTATESEPAENTKESTPSEQIILNQVRKEVVDALVQEFGLEKVVDVLKSLSVVKLRNLAREYKDLGLAGRAISKANKELLIQKLKGYYERGSEK
ncbi:BMC domain-containing protein [Desulforamulus aeronauticus]|uniref:BMC domain-containing protein n=1 Tax=Desulforamulus aeronauticus DSM 10349 TaxID=1121421 RepID=A0A1M6WAI3_9FIRM|nr:BMC domain-containing protein [Desulforamulus aeronauticus]SHK90783.1 BMC domain-containing protein [Desulforamulus aeronauticus DSM 10349]